MEHGRFEQLNQAKRKSNFYSGQSNNRVVYIAFTKSSEPKRFVRRLSKVESKYIQEEQPN